MNIPKAAAIAALCTQLGGCFIFIPGSVVGAVSDAVTGSSGEHCVGRGVNVGDNVRDPYTGFVYRVESLSGTSMRCNQPDRPIRAALAKVEAPASQATSSGYVPWAKRQPGPGEVEAVCKEYVTADSLPDDKRRDVYRRAYEISVDMAKCRAIQ